MAPRLRRGLEVAALTVLFLICIAGGLGLWRGPVAADSTLASLSRGGQVALVLIVVAGSVLAASLLVRGEPQEALQNEGQEDGREGPESGTKSA